MEYKNKIQSFLYLGVFAMLLAPLEVSRLKRLSILLGIGLLTGLALSSGFVYASNQEASTTSPICGNNIQESDEQCDGSDLNGQTCAGLGYTSGTLSCNTNCTFYVADCVTDAPAGGGGGGGGGVVPPPPVTSVIFSGRAYPKRSVTLLKDAQIAATTIAGADANFQISLSGLSPGSYIFSIYSEDIEGRRSSLFTFPISVAQGATTEISGIFIAPTIAVDKSKVKKGDNIAIFGQSVSEAEVIVEINSDQPFFDKTKADKDGIYLYNFNTALLEMGEHFTKSKASLNGEISPYSQAVGFVVGTETIDKDDTGCGRADLNCEGRVNLVDFSIMAYWYDRLSPPDNVDLNGDGKINLVDFSIMAYYWTG